MKRHTLQQSTVSFMFLFNHQNVSDVIITETSAGLENRRGWTLDPWGVLWWFRTVRGPKKVRSDDDENPVFGHFISIKNGTKRMVNLSWCRRNFRCMYWLNLGERFKKHTVHPTAHWEIGSGNWMNNTHRHISVYYYCNHTFLIDLISLSDWGYTLGIVQTPL